MCCPGTGFSLIDHGAVAALGVFLDDNAIGAFRKWRSGEDPHGFARSDGAFEAMPAALMPMIRRDVGVCATSEHRTA